MVSGTPAGVSVFSVMWSELLMTSAIMCISEDLEEIFLKVYNQKYTLIGVIEVYHLVCF